MLRARLFSFCVLAVILFALSPAVQAGYMDTIMASNPTGYWRLGETVGTDRAYDSANAAGAPQYGAQDAGNYGGVTFGVPGALAGDANTAAAFDGGSLARLVCSTTDSATFNFATTDPWTVEGWIKSTDTKTMQPIVSNYNLGPGYFVALFNPGNTTGGGGVLAQIGSDSSHQIYKYTSGLNLDDGHWHYVAATYDGGGTSASSLSIFVDGSQVTSGLSTQDATLGSTQRSTPDFEIGSARAGLQTMDGAMDEVAVYYSVLSDATIQQHYLAGITIPEPSALVLLATGLIGLLAYAWRKRK